MNNISRLEFVEILNKVIKNVRKKITIGNQKSGYKKFHKEIRDNDYVSVLRENLDKINLRTLSQEYYCIKQAGLGYCDEISAAAAYKLSKFIKKQGAAAKIKIVRTISDKAPYPIPHTFLRVDIHLKHELQTSSWEFDVWEPRYIDISPKVDGILKNEKYLKYGKKVYIEEIFSTENIDCSKNHKYDHIAKPKPGLSSRSPTPEKEIFKKNKGRIYSDHSINTSSNKKFICPYNELYSLQQPSNWQFFKVSEFLNKPPTNKLKIHMSKMAQLEKENLMLPNITDNSQSIEYPVVPNL